MRFAICLLFLAYLCAACTGPGQAGAGPAALPSAASTPTPYSTMVVPTPMSIPAYILSLLPRCTGIQILAQPVKFDWPNVEKRLKDLEGADWGYFSCPQPAAEISAFYREQIPKPPYNLKETNWVDRSEGALGIYYHDARLTWMYVWVVPQPGNAQAAYVIAAQTASEAFEPECRLDQPQRKAVTRDSIFPQLNLRRLRAL